jgi:hypothetical protein
MTLFVTLSESVAVTVSYLVPFVTELATVMTPVFVSIVNPAPVGLIEYLIAPVPVPTNAVMLEKVFVTPVVEYKVPNALKEIPGLTTIVIGVVV